MVKSKVDYNLEYIFIYELFDLTIPCIFSERNDTYVYITEVYIDTEWWYFQSKHN